jgi:hypothetical protein
MGGSVVTDGSGSSTSAVLWFIVAGACLYIVYFVPLMGVFAKAGRPGWAAYVPFYNLYVLLQVVGRPGWWLVLYLVPVVNIVIAIIVWVDLARSFRRGAGFAVGLVLLSWIFLGILWMGDSRYAGPSGQTVSGTT